MLNPKFPSVPQSSENVVPREDTNGIVQPIFALYASIWAIGMLETVAHATPFSPRPVQVDDVVGEPGAAGAELVRAVVHELVDGELHVIAEQVAQRGGADGRFERVVVELDHRQPAPPGGERAQRPGGFLLRLEQLVAGLPPLGGRHDLRFGCACHGAWPPYLVLS